MEVIIVTPPLRGAKLFCAVRIGHAAFLYSPAPSEIEEGVRLSVIHPV